MIQRAAEVVLAAGMLCLVVLAAPFALLGMAIHAYRNGGTAWWHRGVKL